MFQCHHAPRIFIKWSSMSRQCWFVSSMQKELSTQNLYIVVKVLTRHFTWRCCNFYETRPDKNTTNCGKMESGGWITPLLLRALHWVWEDFFFTKNCIIPLTHLFFSSDLAPCRSFFVLPHEEKLSEKTFCKHERGKEKNDGGVERYHFGFIWNV